MANAKTHVSKRSHFLDENTKLQPFIFKNSLNVDYGSRNQNETLKSFSERYSDKVFFYTRDIFGGQAESPGGEERGRFSLSDFHLIYFMLAYSTYYECRRAKPTWATTKTFNEALYTAQTNRRHFVWSNRC